MTSHFHASFEVVKTASFRPWSHFGTLQAAVERLMSLNVPRFAGEAGATGTAKVYRVELEGDLAERLRIQDPHFSGALSTMSAVTEALFEGRRADAEPLKRSLVGSGIRELNQDWINARKARWLCEATAPDGAAATRAVEREAVARRRLWEAEDTVTPLVRELLAEGGYRGLWYENAYEDEHSISLVELVHTPVVACVETGTIGAGELAAAGRANPRVGRLRDEVKRLLAGKAASDGEDGGATHG